MTRNSIILRILAALTVTLVLLSVAAAKSGTVLLDAKLAVERGDLEGATVTVSMDNAPVQTITKGLRRFVLELELGHVYLLSFAKPGCVTKELLLDANTPEEQAGKEFGFYFQLTLDPGADQGAHVTPVAVIKYDASERGFNYDRAQTRPFPTTGGHGDQGSHSRKQVRPFEDPTSALAAWAEEKRSAQ